MWHKIVNINFLHDNLSAIRENEPGKEPSFMGVSRGGYPEGGQGVPTTPGK